MVAVWCVGGWYQQPREARAVESSKLLNYGLQFFDTPRLYMNKKPVSKLPVFKGKSELEIGVSRDVYVSVPKGTARKIQVQMTTQKPLLAPIKAGQTVGKLSFCPSMAKYWLNNHWWP